MNINERCKYLHKMRSLYGRASRRQKSALLTEMEPVTGLHRNSLLRLLHGDLRRKPRRRQRGPTCTAVTRQVVRLCAEALDDPCAERPQPVLLPTARALTRHGHLHLTPEVEAQRAHISVSTARRMVGPVGQQPSRLAALLALPQATALGRGPQRTCSVASLRGDAAPEAISWRG